MVLIPPLRHEHNTMSEISDVPLEMLRTSLPGETGLGPHTPSTCAGMYGYSYHYVWS